MKRRTVGIPIGDYVTYTIKPSLRQRLKWLIGYRVEIRTQVLEDYTLNVWFGAAGDLPILKDEEHE